MSATQSLALKHWARIIKRWPVDKVRPENVSFQSIMQRRINKIDKPESVAPITSPANANDVPSAPVKPFNEAQEMQQANALYSLLENRYADTYPMPQSLRNPASSPSHYDDVVREMAEAPSRSWFSSFTQRIKGSLRLS